MSRAPRRWVKIWHEILDHRRGRVFVLARLPYTDSARLERTERAVMEGEGIRGQHSYITRPDRRRPSPRICRRTDGLSHRVDRLRGLGNAVVPQIPEIIGRMILEVEGE